MKLRQYIKDHKTISSIAGILGGVILFWLCIRLLDVLYMPAGESWYDQWYRILFHSYEQQDDIDNLFVGTSHVHCDISPEILDEINGKNNFNLANPGQSSADAYYLLREALGDHRPEHVYLECYYLTYTQAREWDPLKNEYVDLDYIRGQDGVESAWSVTYAMKPSVNRVGLFAHTVQKDRFIETMFPFARYRTTLFEWDMVADRLAYRRSEAYRSYEYAYDFGDDGVVCRMEIAPKGQQLVYNMKIDDDDDRIIEKARDLSNPAFGEKSIKYLKKAIELCRKKNVPITLFISPVYDLELMSTGGYDNYLTGIRSIADEYGIDLYDFNLMKTEYLDIKHGDYFWDCGHLNTDGTALFTPVCWDVLGSPAESNADRFYGTYMDKLLSDEPEILGLCYIDSEPTQAVNPDGSPVYAGRTYAVVTNRPDMACSVDVIPEGSKDKEHMTNRGLFDLPMDWSGTIQIHGEYDGKEYSLELDYTSDD